MTLFSFYFLFNEFVINYLFYWSLFSSEALPWGSNLVSGASVGAIKGAVEFADSGITVQGTDPSSSRLDRSDGGVQPVFEGVAVNNVAAGSSNHGTAPMGRFY